MSRVLCCYAILRAISRFKFTGERYTPSSLVVNGWDATFGRMNVHENILGTIGNTPMIRLNAIAEDFPCPIWAKAEYFNPGHSVKDRMALSMIEAAEASGKPGQEGRSLSARPATPAWALRSRALSRATSSFVPPIASRARRRWMCCARWGRRGTCLSYGRGPRPSRQLLQRGGKAAQRDSQ